MGSKKDLVKIGQKGFAILDEYHSRKGRQYFAPPKPSNPKNSYASHETSYNCFYQYQPQKPKVYQINPVSRTETMLVQNHKAKKPDLVKIGLEGFAELDAYSGRKPGPSPQTARYYQSQPEKPHVYQMKPAYATEERVMDAFDAAKLYGGVLINYQPLQLEN